MSIRSRLLGVPVKIVSHAGPSHRGHIGPILAVCGYQAKVEVALGYGYAEHVWVNLKGLRVFRKKG